LYLRSRIKWKLDGIACVIICLITLSLGALAIEAQLDLALSVPECNVRINPGERASLPRSQTSQFVVEVRPRVGAVRYGSIRVMLNGESMNREMTINGVEGGYDCVVAASKGSFLSFRDGDNTVEVSLTDTWNHVHRVTFTIILPPKASS
jgi:hypothetical protein